MERVILPKGTTIKLNGIPCELTQDTEVNSATIAGMGLEAFLRWSEDGHGEPQEEWPTQLEA